MSLDLAAIRTEIAQRASLPGWNHYGETEGAFELDAIVAGLPDGRITFDGSMSFAKIPLPVYVLASSADPAECEKRIVEAAMTISTLLAGASGRSFASCRVAGVTTGLNVTVGAITADASIIHLELLARH